LAGIDPVEIDQTLQRRAQWRVIVIARFVGTARWPNGRRRQARHKEIRRAEQQDAHGARLIEQLVLSVVILDMLKIRYAEWRNRDRVPKLAQRVDPLLRRIAGDDRRIDGADRDSSYPIGMQIGLGERLIDTCLIGSQRAAA